MLTHSFVSKLLNLKKSSRVVLIFSVILLCVSMQTDSICQEEKKGKQEVAIILQGCFFKTPSTDSLNDANVTGIQSPFHPGKLPRREGPPFDDDAGTPIDSPMYKPGPPMDDARTLCRRPLLIPGPPFDND